METQLISHIDGYSLLIRHFPNNFYHINIIDTEGQVHHFEGIYSSPQVAIDKGKSVIDNLFFWRAKALK